MPHEPFLTSFLQARKTVKMIIAIEKSLIIFIIKGFGLRKEHLANIQI